MKAEVPGAPLPGATVSRAEFLNLFFAVFLPMFMAAIDQTLLATATPSIAGSLGDLRDSSWIAVAYLLASAGVLPVCCPLRGPPRPPPPPPPCAPRVPPRVPP